MDNGTGIMRRERITILSLYDYISLGPRYIFSVLKKGGYPVSMVFLNTQASITYRRASRVTQKERSLLIGFLRDTGTRILGISVASPFLEEASSITSMAQNELGIEVLWGGPHPAILPEESLKTADAVCIGEGESAMLELAERLRSGKDLSDTRNIFFRKTGAVGITGASGTVEDLDKLPFPDYTGEDKYFITEGRLYHGDPATFSGRGGGPACGSITVRGDYYIAASRGCPFDCTYCCSRQISEVSGSFGRARTRSAENVILEIEAARRSYPMIKRIGFCDENFNCDTAWLEEFSEKYRERVGLPFICGLRPDQVTGEKMLLLRRASLASVFMGIESGSERVRRDIYNRKITDEVLLNAASVIKRHGIRPSYDMIMDNPFEDEEEKMRGLELLLRLPLPFDILFYSFCLFPGKKTVIRRALLDKMGDIYTEEDIEKGLTSCEESGDNYTKPIRDRYWYALYSLTSKSFIPRWLIRLMARPSLLRRYPFVLFIFAWLLSVLKFFPAAVLCILKQRIRSRGLKNIIRNN